MRRLSITAAARTVQATKPSTWAVPVPSAPRRVICCNKRKDPLLPDDAGKGRHDGRRARIAAVAHLRPHDGREHGGRRRPERPAGRQIRGKEPLGDLLRQRLRQHLRSAAAAVKQQRPVGLRRILGDGGRIGRLASERPFR